MNHVSRHIVGYATILAGVITVVTVKLESGWPKNSQDWTLLGLAAAGALCSNIIGYRAPYGGKPNENPTPAPPKPPAAP